MKYSSMKELCKYLGNVAEQDYLFREKRRWVKLANDFSQNERREAKDLSEKISVLLSDADGKEWEEILEQLHQFIPFIGFKTQDHIIETMWHSGINVKRGRSK